MRVLPFPTKLTKCKQERGGTNAKLTGIDLNSLQANLSTSYRMYIQTTQANKGETKLKKKGVELTTSKLELLSEIYRKTNCN